MTDRERTWSRVHDAIAAMPGWAVGPATWHGERASWHVAAIDLNPRGRLAKREMIGARLVADEGHDLVLIRRRPPAPLRAHRSGLPGWVAAPGVRGRLPLDGPSVAPAGTG